MSAHTVKPRKAKLDDDPKDIHVRIDVVQADGWAAFAMAYMRFHARPIYGVCDLHDELRQLALLTFPALASLRDTAREQW